MITINKQEMSWGDILVTLLGRPVGGCIGIEYKTKQDKEALYGAGRSARAIQHGKRAVDGSVTILQSELVMLNASAQAAGYKDALSLTFDIVVSYIGAGGVIVNDIIRGATLTELPSGMNQGDQNSKHQLPFLALDVDYNV